MIEVDHVGKRFGKFQAVDDLSFSLKSGQVTGFLGPNGAGKTTTMRLITGYYRPDQGQVRLDGMRHDRDGLAIRRRLGYLPEATPLYTDMTVIEHLELTARLQDLRGVERRRKIRAAVEACDLGDLLKRRVGVLSKGMKQRLGLAIAVLHEPDILLLDEPTTGLDPNQATSIQGVIRRLGAERTLLLSTHLLHQTPELCERVILIHQGRLRFDGSPQDLAENAGASTEARLTVMRSPKDVAALAAEFDCDSRMVRQDGEHYHYLWTGAFDLARSQAIFEALRSRGWAVGAWAPVAPSLERAFAALTEVDP